MIFKKLPWVRRLRGGESRRPREIIVATKMAKCKEKKQLRGTKHSKRCFYPRNMYEAPVKFVILRNKTDPK